MEDSPVKSIRWAAVMAAATLMACGGSDSVGPGTGGGPAFTATVSGDVQTSIKGDARFGEATDPNSGDIFAVEMSENDSTGGGVIQLIHIGSGVPGAGTYGLADAVNGNPGDGDWVAAAYDTDNGQLTASFAATSGSVKVTRTDNGTYQGTFDFIATGAATADPGTVLTIAVNGKFKAKKVTGVALRAAPSLRAR
jgi:hypothetical protein